MDITRFAIERNRVFIMFFLILMSAGIGAYLTLPKNEDPGFIVRTAFIQTMLPGASPQRVEQLVTDRLEKEIQQMPEIKNVRSESLTGVSLVYVDIKAEHTHLRPIWDKLRRKVNDAKNDLPKEIRGPFVNDEFGDIFGTVVAITGDGFNYRQLKQVADEVKNELLLLSNVAKVNIIGAQEERIFLEYENARLVELGISPNQLQGILSQKNIIRSGGDFSTRFEKVIIEPTGNFDSIDDIANTIINLPGTNAVVKLGDVVRIKRGTIDPQEMIMRNTGEAAIAIAISLKEGGNIIELGEEVKAMIEYVKTVYPIGLDFQFLWFQADDVEKKINEFLGNVWQAIAIVLAVMLLFLGLRTGFIVASLIPSAMVMTLFVMQSFDIGIDQMSLASLIIALGMLVDNAIVMSESIIVRTNQGEPVKQASIESAKELRMPLLISSLTTSAAFLPIFLAESQVGEYTAPLFKVVTITLIASWLLALTLVPLLCVLFLKVKKQAQSESFDSGFYSRYKSILLGLLKRPWLSVVGVIGVFYISLQGFAFVENVFFPENDKPVVTVEVETPEGSPIERTLVIVDQIETFIRDNLMVNESRERGFISWGTYIGEGPPRFTLSAPSHARASNYAMVLGNITDVDIAKEEIFPKVEAFILANFPDVTPTVDFLPLGTAGGAPIAIRVMGRDQDKLFELVEEVKNKLANIPGTKNIIDDWGVRSKKIVLDIDNTRAQLSGVTNDEVASAMQTYLTGLETTNYREGDKLIPVVLRSKHPEDKPIDFTLLSNIGVYSQATGKTVPLSQVATLDLEWQTSKILRRDRLKTVTVSAYMEPGFNALDATFVAKNWLEQQDWPFGYRWELGGEYEGSVEAQESIFAKLPIAGLIMLMLLVWQFNSMRKTVIVLLTIPLSLIGVVFGLVVTDLPFGFMTMLGVISLAGIVINNAIVLLDRIKIENEENDVPIHEAVVYACLQRLRPILLTTATTIGGMLPLAVAGGPLWESMAVAIIFGILLATLLTLGVVPLLYSLFYRVKYS
ncbi:efflux RND transporter permease subunit [Pleionea sp. CnH1-48]|uniref:efflux RND transporter permease subunit n=1 Tax=Pleionea sp. CnH1-48 TaxID=2954494 RepID=UPI002096E48D|nr:efflux RND transporter permease subunit [Pleionea sp. CnH1-48]MCO7223367.1 efflux RND transporter permease subunit [Pleionea sp. CnH1-48]